ncbi:helix-turn-helix domain-containing protein [Paenibacillus sp. LMG 31460]|uniref:Helix-turn-helix domain-containing protein n=1 Tax=Paenibacillus germinis TaxID=2654979 RepID=A0ABX1ZBK6_9BACL|nr:AraC family transcriptional regulator [Paenibacillus germinis]NOU90735.1 helix-turn-helix domain-containing protein [Paenibacillus germinis]
MTIYPFYLTDYPRLLSSFPFTIDIHQIDTVFPSHRHDFLEISFVIEGRGTETVNGISHPMEPGTLTLILPYQFHQLQAEPGYPLRLYNCMFSAELLTASNEHQPGFMDILLSMQDDRPSSLNLSGPTADQFTRMLQELLVEYERSDKWRETLLKAKLTELLVNIDRLRNELKTAKTVQTTEKGGRPNIVWTVIYYMHIHYREHLTLSALAEKFHFHETYLSEQIKKHAGQNFVQLLHDIRIRHACSLLVSTEMTIADIAYEVGYGSGKTLFKAFQERKGLTPGAYRKTIH